MSIDGTTKLYGIIGWPVSHSLSPVFQTYFLQQSGFHAAYLPFAVRPELLQQAVDGLWALDVQGFNVTVPHKEQVSQFITPDADAARIGAINTARRASSGWLGGNTDWQGFAAVVSGLDLDLQGKEVLLFGAGGTARAVLHALSKLSLRRVYVCNRNAERLEAFAAFARQAYPDLDCETVCWRQEDVAAAGRDATLLVNTTSIGLQQDQMFPFSLSAAPGGGAAIDAVYRPDGNTAFLAAAGSGRHSVDGLPMLIAQGAASFAWWHDCAWPDCSRTLGWMEKRLERTSTAMPGWEAER